MTDKRENYRKRMKIYRDAADWWIGVYLGPNHIYVCPLPTLVFRFDRRARDHE